jgi:hypothetical protein
MASGALTAATARGWSPKKETRWLPGWVAATAIRASRRAVAVSVSHWYGGLTSAGRPTPMRCPNNDLQLPYQCETGQVVARVVETLAEAVLDQAGVVVANDSGPLSASSRGAICWRWMKT